MKDKWQRFWVGWHDRRTEKRITWHGKMESKLKREAALLIIKSNQHRYQRETMHRDLLISHGIEPMVKLPDGKVISYDLQKVRDDYLHPKMFPYEKSRMH